MLSYNFIDTPAQLAIAIERIIHIPIIAFDTEFDHNHYAYGFTLCLIQIATPDEVFLIDTLAVKDLDPIWQVLQNPAIEKIIHDCGEDMRLLYLHNCKPQNIFDTSVAAKMLELEKIGLGSLLQHYVGVEVSKSKQQSNWLKRPLQPIQLEYAANDVSYLLELRNKMEADLKKKNRWEWFEQMIQFLAQKDYAPKPKTTFLSKKEQKQFDARARYILNELYRFRDKQAQLHNRPSYQLISEEAMYKVLQQPESLRNWQQQKGVYHRLQTAEIGQQLQRTYEEAAAKFDNAIPISTSKSFGTRHPYQQAHFKNNVFLPIKKAIESQFGVALSTFLLSNETINLLIAGTHRLADVAPSFQQEIIKNVAISLQIDLTDFI